MQKARACSFKNNFLLYIFWSIVFIYFYGTDDIAKKAMAL